MAPNRDLNRPEAELSEEWFRAHALIGVDPALAAAAWSRWLVVRVRTEEARFRMALQLASGLSEAAIRHYRAGRGYKLGARTLQELDTLARALGSPAPSRAIRDESAVGRRRGPRQIALLTPLTSLPSPSYHLEVIRGIVAGTARHALATALHAVEPDELRPALDGILRAFRPAAVVLLRVTPDTGSLDLLARRGFPAVLVHADRFRYPCPPVLFHVIPAQESIAKAVEGWAHRVAPRRAGRTRPRRAQGEVVVVAMPREQPQGDFERIPGVEPSLRNRRIDLILEGLREFRPAVFWVEDYSFRHAPAVLAAYPNAWAYLCLGDELAAAIKHLLAATGREWRDRVLGFDDSRLAHAERISSFGQYLERIGDVMADRLGQWLGTAGVGAGVRCDDFEEIATDVYLIARD
jgi:DNA-binding LacI/PurR family transcriptional regulator